MTDNVTPFRRRKPEPLPPEQAALHRRAWRAQPGARALAAEQHAKQMAGYEGARSRQESERLIATGKIVPARITIALDMNELEGPEVDIACGGAEPDVDMWELGVTVPSPEQVNLLAKLTGYKVAWFYRPMTSAVRSGPMFMCGSGNSGCTLRAPDVIDENGVLLYEGKPRRVPGAAKAAAKRANAEGAGQTVLF